MKNFELIIFDCDGVLVDSEKLANEVFAKILLKECGLSLHLDDMYRIFVGHSSAQCMAIIEDMLATPAPAYLEQRYQEEINATLAKSVEAVKGIEQVLDNLTTPFCVASSGSHKKMRTTLGRTKLLPYFEGKLHSISDVKHGKPAPDIYLYAAAQMGNIAPTRCLVIEDSALGVKGGIAADMTVFGYCELTDKNKLVEAGAHHTFNDMNTLLEDIAQFLHSA